MDWDLTTGYLKLPGSAIGNLIRKSITLDQAVALTKEYIPSFIEVYATYVATADYKRADLVYDYYVDNMRKDKPLELKLITYEKYVVEKTEKLNPKRTTKYYKTNSKGTMVYKDIGINEFYHIRDEIKANRKWWQNLTDDIKKGWTDFINGIQTALDALWNEIAKIIGYHTKVSTEYVTVVAKGAAYEYMTTNEYRLGVEEYEIVSKDVIDNSPPGSTPVRYPGSGVQELRYQECTDIKDAEGNITGKSCKDPEEWEMAIEYKAVVSYDQRKTICQHVLIPTANTKIEKYGETPATEGSNNRYTWIINQIDKAEKEKAKNNPFKKEVAFSSDDTALALDVIQAYYSNSFGLLGSLSVQAYKEGTSKNSSVVNFAEQFINRKWTYFMSIDDTGIFIPGEWCAMFVSYIMKKADVGVKTFLGCTTFWELYQDEPGFYDIKNTNAGSNITNDASHVKANHNGIAPGDILLFRWNTYGAKRNHTGICKSVEYDNNGNVIKIITIEGNTGGGGYTGSKVSERTYSGSSLKQIVSYVSIYEVENSGGW